MATNFLAPDVWPKLRKVAKRQPAYVAVAYFSDKAASMLPLAAGSCLVVDASEQSVKAGRTCPAELGKLLKNGVRVFSVPNLHAKVYVFGDRAFIGSANASRNSRERLVEGMIATDQPRVVAEARAFVRGLCRPPELGPETVARLQKMYRPPRTFINGRPRGETRVPIASKVHLAQLIVETPPSGGEVSYDAGEAAARKRMEQPRRHLLDDFFWHGPCAIKRDDVVVQVVEQTNRKRMVVQPGKVLEVRRWSSRGPERYWIFLEVPIGRRVEVGRLAKRVGYGAKKALRRNGRVSASFADRLLRAWNQ